MHEVLRLQVKNLGAMRGQRAHNVAFGYDTLYRVTIRADDAGPDLLEPQWSTTDSIRRMPLNRDDSPSLCKIVSTFIICSNRLLERGKAAPSSLQIRSPAS